MDCQICDICTEKINRSTRVRVKCEYCEFSACRTCFETYLLSQSTPHCMCSKEQCGKIWTRKFLAKTFTNVFITKRYKTHQEQILFVKELALMPATQILIEKILHTTEYYKWIRYIDDRPFNDKRYYISNQKVKELGWEIKKEFDDGINELLQGYKLINKYKNKDFTNL